MTHPDDGQIASPTRRNAEKENRRMKTTKEEVVNAGKEMSARSTPAQQANHVKVISWIESLPESRVLDYSHHKDGRTAGAVLAYKLMVKEWYDATNVNPVSKN
jgi:hypothetical protein